MFYDITYTYHRFNNEYSVSVYDTKFTIHHMMPAACSWSNTNRIAALIKAYQSRGVAPAAQIACLYYRYLRVQDVTILQQDCNPIELYYPELQYVSKHYPCVLKHYQKFQTIFGNNIWVCQRAHLACI